MANPHGLVLDDPPTHVGDPDMTDEES